jgi:hypothetical protein
VRGSFVGLRSAPRARSRLSCVIAWMQREEPREGRLALGRRARARRRRCSRRGRAPCCTRSASTPCSGGPGYRLWLSPSGRTRRRRCSRRDLLPDAVAHVLRSDLSAAHRATHAHVAAELLASRRATFSTMPCCEFASYERGARPRTAGRRAHSRDDRASGVVEDFIVVLVVPPVVAEHRRFARDRDRDRRVASSALPVSRRAPSVRRRLVGRLRLRPASSRDSRGAARPSGRVRAGLATTSGSGFRSTGRFAARLVSGFMRLSSALWRRAAPDPAAVDRSLVESFGDR